MTKMVRTYPELLAEKDNEIKRLNIVLDEKIDQIIDAEGSLKLTKLKLAELEREIITLMNFLTAIKHTTDLALMKTDD
jgi:hypothetical protein